MRIGRWAAAQGAQGARGARGAQVIQEVCGNIMDNLGLLRGFDYYKAIPIWKYIWINYNGSIHIYI